MTTERAERQVAVPLGEPEKAPYYLRARLAPRIVNAWE